MNIQLIFIAPLLLILYGSEVYEHLTEEQSALADVVAQPVGARMVLPTNTARIPVTYAAHILARLMELVEYSGHITSRGEPGSWSHSPDRYATAHHPAQGARSY
jgi:hypothetical protein